RGRASGRPTRTSTVAGGFAWATSATSDGRRNSCAGASRPRTPSSGCSAQPSARMPASTSPCWSGSRHASCRSPWTPGGGGRPRRCGWFDAVVVRYAVRVNGLTGLAVTKLDVLDTFAEIPVCVGYRLDGQPCDAMPADVERLARVAPTYEVLPGWHKSLSEV